MNEKFYDTKPHVDKINNLRINNSCNGQQFIKWVRNLVIEFMHDNKCSY